MPVAWIRCGAPPVGTARPRSATHGSVPVDGCSAGGNDQPGPLFDWWSGGDVPVDESGEVTVSQTSDDHIRPYGDRMGATPVGRGSWT